MCLLPSGVDRCAYYRGGGFDRCAYSRVDRCAYYRGVGFGRCAYSRVVSTDVPTIEVVVSTGVPTPALTEVPTTEVKKESSDVPSGGEVRVVSLKGCLASTAESSSSGGHSSSPVMSDGDSSVDENSFVLRGTNCTGPVGAAG